MIDWKTIETEYVTTDISHRQLAEKYGIGRSRLSQYASKEKWKEKRDKHRANIVAKTIEKIGKKQVDKMARIDKLADKLLEKLEKAVSQLDMQLVKHTDKTKTIEYGNCRRPDKPTREVVHEEEKVLEVSSIIDRQGLKQISSALKDIKEVKMLTTELDRQEQEARIDKLRAEAGQRNHEDDDDETGVILMPAVLEVKEDG